MTIDELLDTYKIFAMSDVEKGERFERLMRNFLLTYPIWRGIVSDVWLWKDFPFRAELGGKDLGIDLVVKTRDGDFWAAQCKFYAESTAISKAAVDSFISNSARTFNGDKKFSRRLWISTSDNFTDNAREMLKNQSPAVEFINLATLRRAQVNWSLLDNGFAKDDAIIIRNLRDYQQDAINAAQIHFQNHNRGQLIMACGTGKTFTALKIAEKLFPRGKILFLVPSISLLSQTLEEWATFSENPLNAICICSDASATNNFDDEIVDVNLPLPAMTDSKMINDKLSAFSSENMTVIFSTYQSIDVVHELNLDFDLIICDEAHRTATLSKDETVFTKIHDDKNVRGKNRIYMTATPKLCKLGVKDSTDENKLTDWTMDNENVFGKEFYRISFREAIAKGCLSDYKVFILTVDERNLNSELRNAINDKNSALTTDDALKIIGCINALSKNMDVQSARLIVDDPSFMQTAVAFNPKIKISKHFAEMFPFVQEKYSAKNLVKVVASHIDGSMKSSERENKLHWLKTPPDNVCHVLNNVRCLSEGVDVPALDAIIFLSSRKSKVDIVQAVGRVMRKAPNKKFGYIIIPVVVPLTKSPEDALAKSADFATVWDVINALRAHDDAMNVEIERIRNTGNSKRIIPGTPPKGASDFENPQLVLEELLNWDELRDKIFARMVEHVGNRLYWIQWADKVVEIVERHTRRINEIINVEGKPRRAFYNFVYDLQRNLNPSVSPADAVDMLAQHLITRPVFEALFENYSFAKNNPVSVAMQNILDKLDADGMTKDREIFNRLYKQVREMCANMGDADNRQRIIIRLYDNFFKFALKKTAEKLGIVYTPVEVVDFILRSVDAVLYKNFGRRLSDRNVHILDPFAGTGTFLVRLIQSGLIKPKDLQRKYQSELHANEIVLLAYYIAAINIENAFWEVNRELGNQVNSKEKNSNNLTTNNLITYCPYNLICLTDTFQLYERGEIPLNLEGVMNKNSERVNEQKNSRIEVIVGNPPYSVGQKSANDNNQNETYSNLEARISSTYAAKTDATNKNSLYDSYIKAFRWASDRISDGGIIGFVTNAGFLDGAAMDGLRKCFEQEFSAIYIYNLRGNQRTQGETSRREGGKIFGSGSRAPIAITILVKNSAHVGKADIFYKEVGDYLTREEKLDAVKNLPSVLSDGFKVIIPNERGDWINQRGDTFETFIPLHESQIPKYENWFMTRSRGLESGRDAWIYNFSRSKLETNIQTTIDYYNTHSTTEIDTKKISWTRELKNDKNRGVELEFDAAQVVEAMYRPFCKTNLYFDEYLVNYPGQMPKFFPTGREDNILICVTCADEGKFSPFITNQITDLHFNGDTQCYPLYYYEGSAQGSLFGEEMTRRDGISDYILNEARKRFGDVSKEDIFYYVYGFLHLPSYREKFSAELKKSLPRIILVDDADKFWQLSRAGRELADIHLNYETQPFADVEIIGVEKNNFTVKKMKLSKDKTTLIYNEHITIKNIPPRSFDYVVNGRSPLEWIIDRYQVKTDKASGIVNDPNAWSIEHGKPRYILDLILSCITVSLKTLDIVENLPEIDFDA